MERTIRMVMPGRPQLILRKRVAAYTRVSCGKDLLLHESKDDICGRREAAMYLLLKLKEIYFPELHGHGHSYGIGHDAVSDRVWSTYMAIRHCMAWHEHPEGGIGCQFDRPFSLGNEPVPECIVKNKGCTGDESVGDQYP